MSIEPWAHLISLEVILELHAENIYRYGGDSTPTPREGCIERSLGTAWSAEGYADSDNAVPGLCFSGYLLYYLILNHCFMDGNKRVAWAACMEGLRSIGLTVDATDDEVEQFCLSIIDKSVARAATVTEWLASKLIALPT